MIKLVNLYMNIMSLNNRIRITYSKLNYLYRAFYSSCQTREKRGQTHGYNSFLTQFRRIHSSSSLSSDHLACHHKEKYVLGIETSCDDTGAAVVDSKGNIIGEALNSQTRTHIQYGGIIPPIARDLHKENIDNIVNLALERANMTAEDLDAIAVTVKPGLSLSLSVGVNFAKQLARQSGKPLIPIHHMEAHALTARMIHRIDFPFMVLLASGGHCLLAVAQDVDKFLLLGTCLDDSPGDALDKGYPIKWSPLYQVFLVGDDFSDSGAKIFDLPNEGVCVNNKTAREMKLKNMKEFEAVSGGAAIEMLAKDGDYKCYTFPTVRTRAADCDFSFSGLKYYAKTIIKEEEKEKDLAVDEVLPNVSDICASLQYGILKHLARRVQRAFLFCELKQLLPDRKCLVLSGGVGSNEFFREGLRNVCTNYQAELICPPPHLCTDNGIMIAWNGMEKLLVGRGIVDDYESVNFQAKCPLGVDIRQEIIKSHLKLPKLKLFV